MDPAIKSLCRTWSWYLLAVVVCAGVLTATGEKSISPRPTPIVDLSASRPGSVSELSKTKDWLSQVHFFNKAFFGPDSSDWHNFPASQVVPASIVQLQQQPKDDRLATLWINGPSENIALNAYTLEVRSRTLSPDIDVPANAQIGPMLRDSTSVSFKLVTRRMFKFLSDNVSSTSSVPLDKLDYDQPVSLELPVLSAFHNAIGQDRLHLRLQLMRFDPDASAVESQREAAATSSDIASGTLTGALSYNDLNVSHDLLITPAGRYTTLIITGDGDLRNYVRCTRTDSGKQVGAYSDRVPMMAVAVNAWASVKVHISLHHFRESLRYRIVTLSGDQVTNKALLLWFVAHDLTDKEIESRVFSLPEIDSRAAWLKTALGVEFTDQEVQNTQDPDVKRLLNHLTKVQ